SGDILRIPKAGGPATVIATSQGAAWSLAVNATSLFWTDADYYTVSRADLDGANPAVVVADQLFGGIAADDTHLYWSAGTVTGSSAMNRANLDGSNAQVLGEVPSGTPAYQIALDATYAYWANQDAGGEILRVPLAGGAPTVLATT